MPGQGRPSWRMLPSTDLRYVGILEAWTGSHLNPEDDFFRCDVRWIRRQRLHLQCRANCKALWQPCPMGPQKPAEMTAKVLLRPHNDRPRASIFSWQLGKVPKQEPSRGPFRAQLHCRAMKDAVLGPRSPMFGSRLSDPKLLAILNFAVKAFKHVAGQPGNHAQWNLYLEMCRHATNRLGMTHCLDFCALARPHLFCQWLHGASTIGGRKAAWQSSKDRQ